MSALLPVFPLGMVAFPGMVVPLHVFEERYRALVRDLVAQPDGEHRRFGIVAIREGYEVGPHEARSMYRVGTVVQLSTVEEYADGRFDISAIGVHRMRVMATDTSAPYLRAEAEELADDASPSVDAARAAAQTLAVFADYRAMVSRLQGSEALDARLPRDPALLSYSLAAACAFTLHQRQQLLEAPIAAERLDMLRRFMRQELGAMRALPSLPATDVARSRWSPN